MSVGIVIPVWNLWSKMTLPCLLSLAKYTNLAEIHVYLVDNASTDETEEEAEQIGKQLFSKEHFTYIKNQENLGFAIACNQGAKEAQKAGHEFILFLNNDTIVTENWLAPLVKALDNPRIGMVGPLLVYPDTFLVQHCGVAFNPFREVRHLYHFFPNQHEKVCHSRKHKLISGAVLLCRTKEFFDCGMFYEGYKNGMEDLDLCCAYLQRGFIHQVIAESVVIHFESQTPGRLQNDILNDNIQLFHQRNTISLDCHLYYAQDGYVPAITKEFNFYVRLLEDKRKEFNKIVKQNYSDSLCLSLLNQEPFWHDGYYFLIESMLKQNNIQNALGYCEFALAQYPKIHTLELFKKIAERIDDVVLAENMINNIELRIQRIENRKEVKAQKLRTYWQGSVWYDKLLETQQFDTDEFGDY